MRLTDRTKLYRILEVVVRILNAELYHSLGKKLDIKVLFHFIFSESCFVLFETC